MSQGELKFRSVALRVLAVVALFAGGSLLVPLGLAASGANPAPAPLVYCEVSCPDGSYCWVNGTGPCQCFCKVGGGARCECQDVVVDVPPRNAEPADPGGTE